VMSTAEAAAQEPEDDSSGSASPKVESFSSMRVSPSSDKSSLPRNLSGESLHPHKKSYSLTRLNPLARTSSSSSLSTAPVFSASHDSKRSSGLSSTAHSPKLGPAPLLTVEEELTSPVPLPKPDLIPVSVIGFMHLGRERQFLKDEDKGVILSVFDPPPPEPIPEPEPEPEPEPPKPKSKKRVKISVAKTRVLPELEQKKEPAVVNCDLCRCPIVNECVEVEGKKYHKDCFVCSICHTPLRRYFKAPSGEGSEALVCEACYQLSHPCENCARCGKQIDEESLKVDGMRLHKKCFICAHCGRELGTRYVTRDGRYFCAPSGNGPQCFSAGLEKPCSVCGKPLAGKKVVVTDDGMKYHRECFVCGICKSMLLSTDYYVAELSTGPTLCCQDCCETLM